MGKFAVTAAVLGISLLSVAAFWMATESTDSSLAGPRPSNIRKCDESADYPLILQSFDVDHDLKPGKRSTMTAVFTPQKTTFFEQMQLQVFLKGTNVWNTKDTKHIDVTAGNPFTYNYSILLPPFIPHVLVSMKMHFIGGETKTEELSCVQFDLQM